MRTARFFITLSIIKDSVGYTAVLLNPLQAKMQINFFLGEFCKKYLPNSKDFEVEPKPGNKDTVKIPILYTNNCHFV